MNLVSYRNFLSLVNVCLLSLRTLPTTSNRKYFSAENIASNSLLDFPGFHGPLLPPAVKCVMSSSRKAGSRLHSKFFLGLLSEQNLEVPDP